MIWYSHLFKNFFQFVVIHTVFGIIQLDVGQLCVDFLHLKTQSGCSLNKNPIKVLSELLYFL